MEKSSNWKGAIPTDKEMMKYLVKYVISNHFPIKHTVMDVDDPYGTRVFTPNQIFGSTEPPPGEKMKNIRFLITFQDLKIAKGFSSKEGYWKPVPSVKPMFDAKKKRMGSVKISLWREKSSTRKKSGDQWHMREYYLTSKYLPQSKRGSKYVLITMIIKTEQKHKHNNDDKSDEEIIQSRHQNDVASQQIMQSLQALQL